MLVLPTLISSLSTAPPKKTCDYNDPLMYIYTSGTTGLPKAAVLKHSRFMFAVYALFTMTLLSEDDVLYSPLPMYHTAAGAMVTGNAMCVPPSFSAPAPWPPVALVTLGDCLTLGVRV